MLVPERTVPVTPKPIVESTEITDDPIETFSNDLVWPGIVNVPSIRSLSLYPTNKESL